MNARRCVPACLPAGRGATAQTTRPNQTRKRQAQPPPSPIPLQLTSARTDLQVDRLDEVPQLPLLFLPVDIDRLPLLVSWVVVVVDGESKARPARARPIKGSIDRPSTDPSGTPPRASRIDRPVDRPNSSPSPDPRQHGQQQTRQRTWENWRMSSTHWDRSSAFSLLILAALWNGQLIDLGHVVS